MILFFLHVVGIFSSPIKLKSVISRTGLNWNRWALFSFSHINGEKRHSLEIHQEYIETSVWFRTTSWKQNQWIRIFVHQDLNCSCFSRTNDLKQKPPSFFCSLNNIHLKIVHFCYFQNTFPFVSTFRQTDDIREKKRQFFFVEQGIALCIQHPNMVQ